MDIGVDKILSYIEDNWLLIIFILVVILIGYIVYTNWSSLTAPVKQ